MAKTSAPRVKVKKAESPKGMVQSRRVTPATISDAIQHSAKAPKFKDWLSARLAEIDVALTANGHPPGARASLADRTGPIGKGKVLTPDHFAASALIIGTEMLEILDRRGNKWISYGMERAVAFAHALHLAEFSQLDDELYTGIEFWNKRRARERAQGITGERARRAIETRKSLDKIIADKGLSERKAQEELAGKLRVARTTILRWLEHLPR